MKPRSLAVLGLLLYCSVTFAQAPKPWKPVPARPPAATVPRPQPRPGVNLINGVPDTGQFLPDSAILGSIDGRTFTVGEFRNRWYASYPLDRPKTDSAGRYEFLNSMVNKEVLAQLAWQVNRPLSFEDRTQLREVRNQWLSNAAFARLVGDSSRPTEADIQRVYEQRQIDLHVQRVVAADGPTAERVRAEVVAGKLPWPEAVRKYSIATHSDKGPDGDAGWAKRNMFTPRTAEQIYELKDGEISGVFEGDSGYEFVRVLGRRHVEIPGLAQLRKVIAGEAREAKVARRMELVRGQVRERIGMAYDSTNIAWAASVFAADESQRAHDAPGTLDLSGVLPEFAPADTARVLARWKGGQYSIGQFLEAFNAIPPPQRGRIGSFSAFRWRLDGFALEPFMVELAVERGYDKDPLVTNGVHRKEEELRVGHLFDDSVQTKTQVTSEMRQKYYAAHQHEFSTFENVTYAMILRHSKAAADSLLARLRAGADPVAVIREDSLAGHPSGSIKTMREDEHEDFRKIVYEELKPGQATAIGPDATGAWAVLQVITHESSRPMSFKEVEGLIDENLQNQESEKLLKQFIARHRAGHTIVLHPERLMVVKLTDPSLD